jgi:hypothetical protein
MRLGLKLEQRGDVRKLVDLLQKRLRQAGGDLQAAVGEIQALQASNALLGSQVRAAGHQAIPGRGAGWSRAALPTLSHPHPTPPWALLCIIWCCRLVLAPPWRAPPWRAACRSAASGGGECLLTARSPYVCALALQVMALQQQLGAGKSALEEQLELELGKVRRPPSCPAAAAAAPLLGLKPPPRPLPSWANPLQQGTGWRGAGRRVKRPQARALPSLL